MQKPTMPRVQDRWLKASLVCGASYMSSCVCGGVLYMDCCGYSFKHVLKVDASESMFSWVSDALRLIRSLSVPGGTVGTRIGSTLKLCSLRRRDNSTALCGSPTCHGWMWLGVRLSPGDARSLHRRLQSCLRQALSASISNDFLNMNSVHSAQAGGKAVEKIKLRQRFIIRCHMFSGIKANAPADARAFPNVPTVMSTISGCADDATIPRPCAPSTPMAWASSTYRIAPG